MKPILPTSLLAAAVLAIAAPAQAQLSSKSDAPIDVTADEYEIIQSACRTTWTGDAEAVQADSRLRARILRTFMTQTTKPGSAEKSCGDLSRLEAEGSVYYVTPQQRIRGDNAVYDAVNETLVVTGDVVAVQGQDVTRANRMVYNVKTGELRVTGTGKGKNAAGRPRAVIYPSKKTTP
jgi:lipopolysaccharide export system protein LptA